MLQAAFRAPFSVCLVGGRTSSRRRGHANCGKKRNSKPQKVNDAKGVLSLRHSFAASLADFVPRNFDFFTLYTGRSNFLLPQREEGMSRG